MTKIGVITDSHRAWRGISEALKYMQDCRYILHLGDHDSDMDDFPEVKDRLISVSGNCDLFSMQPGKRFMTVEGVRILFCHGDGFRVKRGLDDLAEAAKREGCSLALYGHTHIRRDCAINGVRIINPGAMKDGGFAVISIDGTETNAEFLNV